MNTKRTIFWAFFLIILVLILWGLVVAMNKQNQPKQLPSPAPVTELDNSIGNPNAPVTLIEYGDFQCPACLRTYSIVEKLISEASSTVRMVFRNFPLYPQPHLNSFITAEAAQAAALQGKFWDMYKVLYINQAEWSDLPDAHEKLYKYAQSIGLDMIKFKTDLDSEVVHATVQSQQDEGNKIGITGTPTFFINGKFISTPSTYDEFKNLIDATAAVSTK